MKPLHRGLSLGLSALLFLTLPLGAQGSAAQAEQGETSVRISLLAVGDPPQPKFEIRGDRRHLIETPASEYPPTRLLVKEKDKFKEISLGLNTPSEPIAYKGQARLEVFKSEGEAGQESYLSVPLPGLDDNITVFLLRNKAKKSWESAPQARFLSNSLQVFPKDSARVLNLSTIPIRVQVGAGRVYELKAGSHRIFPLQRKTQGIMTYRIAAVVEDKVFPLVDTAMTYTPDSRINLVAYNADGEDKRQPVKVTKFFELAPARPAPKVQQAADAQP